MVDTTISGAKMTRQQWADARARWEGDKRVGYAWLVREMGLPVGSPAVGARAKRESWAKATQSTMRAGRPTLYQDEYADQARKLCLLGATNDDLARFFEVSVSSIVKWILEFNEFSTAVKNGREVADANVANRLYERATGYSHPDTDIRVIENQIVKTEVMKHYPPDTAAAFIWLKNRAPHRWRDRVEVEENVTIALVDKEAMAARYSAAMQRAEDRRLSMRDRRERLLLEFDGDTAQIDD